MVQTLALLTKNPDFNIPGMARDAQNIRIGEQNLRAGEQDIEAGGMANDLAALQLRDATDESNTLMGFRNAIRSGQPNAMGQLAAYPELQAKMAAAYKAMKPDEQDAFIKRGERIGRAAQEVASYPPGSEARTKAWNAQLDDLLANKIIDQARYDEWVDNPSDLVIDQALTLGQTVSQFREQRASTRTAAAGPSTEDLADIDEEARKLAEAQVPEMRRTPEVMGPLIEQMRQDIIARRYPAAPPVPVGKSDRIPAKDTAQVPGLPALDTVAPGGGPGGGGGTLSDAIGATAPVGGPPAANANVPATHINAITITSREQLEALPSGTPVILPDGRATYRK